MAKRFSGRDGCITTERTEAGITERVSFSIDAWVIFNYSPDIWRGTAKARHVTSMGGGEGTFRRPGGEYNGKIVIESVFSDGVHDESEIHFSGKGKLGHISHV
jgi:hypothetical protein